MWPGWQDERTEEYSFLHRCDRADKVDWCERKEKETDRHATKIYVPRGYTIKVVRLYINHLK